MGDAPASAAEELKNEGNMLFQVRTCACLPLLRTQLSSPVGHRRLGGIMKLSKSTMMRSISNLKSQRTTRTAPFAT